MDRQAASPCARACYACVVAGVMDAPDTPPVHWLMAQMSLISPSTDKKSPGATAERILFLLKTRGPLKTADLAPLLKVSQEAARQQLQKLVDSELIVGQLMPAQGAGRPSQKWVLTELAQARFPDTHANLTLQLIDSIRAVYGADGVERIVSDMERANSAEYLSVCAPLPTLEQRVRALAQIREVAGYMASVEADGDAWLLIESHCPICVAAQQCQGFCRSELQVFQAAIGELGQVQRVEHLITGDRRCVYRIRATPVS
ncbi:MULTISPECIES: metalloregulator ArsR/SmtB family transcription factor [unclassified Pseudomonas]|uniref:helix-turn-helix transcriptional regulator n=1 Tax=unclassified Pseudomonas TaxID=196821 RepID=UPI000930E336|nr:MULTISPECIES: metalloregulator ArsR/SmtB family transcription factor [unclassified Pseudomonas]